RGKKIGQFHSPPSENHRRPYKIYWSPSYSKKIVICTTNSPLPSKLVPDAERLGRVKDLIKKYRVYKHKYL
ncbi:MAG: hypothetical protein M0Q12_12645, partial [Synergistaceae bacterium]|nr:hypothetical protein [Synergistaceae bacterium]